MEALTDKDFWSSYWNDINLPSKLDETRPFERCLIKKLDFFLEKYLKKQKNNSIFEIGCAPGKWLSYLSHKHHLKPHGIEYLEKTYRATSQNLEASGLVSTGIIQGDFFETPPQPIHDIVISLGFIEHFDNVTQVVDRHLQWLKPGGLLILGVPNFSNFNGTIQAILNKSVLESHNTQIMNQQFFRTLAKTFSLETDFIGYLGSFEPVMFIGDQYKPNKLQFCINVSLQILKKVRQIKLFDYINSPLFSSYLLSIYRKPMP